MVVIMHAAMHGFLMKLWELAECHCKPSPFMQVASGNETTQESALWTFYLSGLLSWLLHKWREGYLLPTWPAVMRRQGGRSNLQWCVSVVHGNGSVCSHFFTFTWMTTEAFSWNVNKVFFELKLVTESCSSLFTLVDQSQSSTSWLTQLCN